MLHPIIRFLAASSVASAAFFTPFVVNSSNFPRIEEAVLNSYPTYNGDDLELKVDVRGTHFALWSPGAEAVRLHLYADGQNGSPCKTEEMKKEAQTGVWRASFGEQLYG